VDILGLLASCSGASADLDAARTATEKYRDLEAAKADGYEFAFLCLNWQGNGWLNPDLLADPALDVETPELLRYDGDYDLVAVDYMILYQDEQSQPEFMGQPMEGPIEVSGSPVERRRFWFLPVWLHRENPDGTFAPENHSVSC